MPATVPVIGVNGEPIFYHPHFPQWRSDICKTCKHVVPIRPIKFSKKLTKEQIEEFKECFQVRRELRPVVNLIKHFTIVIYNSRVELTRKLPILRLLGCNLHL